ncbi:MAG TPA: hypothetical protein VF705_05165 [Longimicrobium sp.]|jgi:hypothetical protein
MIRFRYDTREYDFAGWAGGLLGVDDLATLHGAPRPSPGMTLEEHRLLMLKKIHDHREQLDPLLHRFVRRVVEPVFGPISSYQDHACLRIHMQGGGSISRFHRDDAWGQRAGVQNVWIPFTRVWGSNTLWVESEPGRGDFAPVSLNYGEAVVFPGAELEHGSVANNSGSTRVSADVRVTPRS